LYYADDLDRDFFNQLSGDDIKTPKYKAEDQQVLQPWCILTFFRIIDVLT
jgi:hypothetical protein